jgi:hypothetical protein
MAYHSIPVYILSWELRLFDERITFLNPDLGEVIMEQTIEIGNNREFS